MKIKKSKNTKIPKSQDNSSLNSKDENKKIPSFLEVVQSLHNLNKLSYEFGKYTYKKAMYLNMNQYQDYAHKSWIVNTFPIVTKMWSDPFDETPDYSTFEGLDEYFYLIPKENKNKWYFSYPGDENCAFQSDLLNYDFNALYYFFNDTYKNEFESLGVNNETFYYYVRTKLYIEYISNMLLKEEDNWEKKIEIRNNMLQFCIFFLNNDKLSFFIKKDIHEMSLFTRNIVQGFNTFSLIMNQNHPLDEKICNMCNVKNIDEYVKKVFIPFFTAYHNMKFCKSDDYFIDLEEDVLSYSIYRNPNPKWEHIGECPQEEIREYQRLLKERYEKSRQERILLEMSKKIESNNEFIETSQKQVELKINSRYIQIKEEEEKENKKEEEKLRNVERIFKKEEDIPKIMRRLNKKPLKEGSSLLLFHYGDFQNHIYDKKVLTFTMNNKKYSYCIRKMVNELPNLLRNEHNKSNFLRSKNVFFERPVNQMPNFFKHQLYDTIISFCEEMASTRLEENDIRMNIIQNYYGKRLEHESLEQYYHNYREDIGNSIALYYVYYLNKSSFHH